MDIIKGFVPEGVEDINSLEFGMKDKVIRSINQVFKSFGYRQILTPTFEYYDLFNEIEGTIEKEEMFKFIDRNGQILVLRPDVTIPIARMGLSIYKDKKEALKFSYSTSVYRTQTSDKRGKAEFIQSGIEFLGEEGIDADAEVLVVAIKLLLDCGFKDFKIDIGQASYFKALIEETKLSKDELDEVKKYIEAKNFTGLEFYIEGMAIEKKVKDAILNLPSLYGNVNKVIERARNLSLNEKMDKAVENLSNIYDVIKEYGYEKYILADLGLVSHINYYTGLVFKGYVSGCGHEVLGGGRYDNLTKAYGEYMPSTGFGINIDAIVDAMKSNFLFKQSTENIDYKIVYEEEKRKEVIKLASFLRENEFSVDVRKSGNSESDLNGYNNEIIIKDKIYMVSELGQNQVFETISELIDSL